MIWTFPGALGIPVPVKYIHWPKSKDMGTTLRPRYIPESYMDPLGMCLKVPRHNVLIQSHVLLGDLAGAQVPQSELLFPKAPSTIIVHT